MNETVIIIGIIALCLLISGTLSALFGRKKGGEIESRLQRMEAVIDGVDSFDIDALKSEVIAKVVEATDNAPRCPECTCLRPEKAKFCRSCGCKFNEAPDECLARVTDWRPVFGINMQGGKFVSEYRLEWTCLDCEESDYERFSPGTLDVSRRFIHPLYCGECESNVGEVIINTDKKLTTSAIEEVGKFGSLSINGRKENNNAAVT